MSPETKQKLGRHPVRQKSVFKDEALKACGMAKSSKYRTGKATGTHAGSIEFERLRKEKRRCRRSQR